MRTVISFSVLFIPLTLSSCASMSFDTIKTTLIPTPKPVESTLADCPLNMTYAERDLDRPYRPDLRVYRTKEGELCRAF